MRAYDADFGRPLQAEPFGAAYIDGMNLYQAYASNPTNLLDPMGTDSWGWEALKTFTDFANGALDEFTFGATSALRDAAGTNGDGGVNEDSAAYDAGAKVETGVEVVSGVGAVKKVGGKVVIAGAKKVIGKKLIGLTDEAAAAAAAAGGLGDDAAKLADNVAEAAKKKKHTPGRGHRRKSEGDQKDKFRKKKEQERLQQERDLKKAWEEWDKMSDDAKKLRPELAPDGPRPSQ